MTTNSGGPWTRQEHERFERAVGERLERLDRGLRRRGRLLVVVLLIVGGLGAWQQKSQSDQTHQIQQQRYRSLLDQCLDSNHKYDLTVQRLEGEVTKALAKHPGRRAEIKANETATIFLIDGLAHRTGKLGDHGAACRARAHQLTHGR